MKDKQPVGGNSRCIKCVEVTRRCANFDGNFMKFLDYSKGNDNLQKSSDRLELLGITYDHSDSGICDVYCKECLCNANIWIQDFLEISGKY